MKVAHFLEQLGMSRYARAFIENAIDYEMLPELSDADLKEMGVRALGHRKKIRQAASIIAGEGSATSGSQSRAQRRQLTLMFADLAGSTRLSDQLDLESYNAIIRAYQNNSKEVIEEHDGFVAKYIGDGVLAYFGYPNSHEDDAERAIWAGIALVERISKLGIDTPSSHLSVRVGIETGPVVVGEVIGEGSSQEHAVVGKTPNLAARLQELAELNTVVVGPVTRRLSESAVKFHALGEYDLKGFDTPVSVWRAVSVTSSVDLLDERQKTARTPLVGRRQELGSLASAFARMRSGETPFVNLVGEPGIGKSRLVREFLEQNLETATVLVGHCASHGDSTAFFPFINLLRRWFGDADGVSNRGEAWMLRLVESGLDVTRHVPYILRLLDITHPTASQIEPDLVGQRTQEALVRFIVNQGQSRSTILFINDAHWIDERSATLLDVLARNEHRRGVLILATLRRRYIPPWSDAHGIEEITLSPLSASESLSLFRKRIPDEAARADLTDIVERAGGNPLFLEELARHVSRSSDNTENESGAAIPETLAGLLMQRVDALSPSARRTAEIASVAGRRFDAALLGEGSKADLAELVSGAVILAEHGGARTYRFQHALVHDVIYESLLESDLRHLHAEVVERLEKQHAGHEIEIAEDFARHHHAAGNPQSAARYAHLAGNKALDLFALSDAQNWYGLALSLLPEGGGREDDLLFARTIVNQTQVLCWNGDFPAMVALAQENLPRVRSLGKIEEVSRSLTWIGEGYMHVGRYDDARATLVQALESGRALEDESCIGYASGELMWLDSIVGEGSDFDSLPLRATELEAVSKSLGDQYLATLALYARWAYAVQIGKVGDALEIARQMRVLGDHNNYPPAVCWGACLESDGHAKHGNASEAESAARAGRDAAACRFDHLMAELSFGMALVASGRTNEGILVLEKAPWRTEKIGALYFAYAGDVAYGKALVASGKVKEGTNWLRDGITWFEQVGNDRAVALASLELARILLKDTSASRARSGFGQRVQEWLSGAQNPYDEARHCLDRVISEKKRLNTLGYCADALVLRAKLDDLAGDCSSARTALAEAKKISSELGWVSLDQLVNREVRRVGGLG
ncbi:ATP-binding protein [Ruegeria hyattellae]|uniref:ATP-binding protein n=1 Tax=Ruegeria hyattellae TaxID=3233337 RepID=UPI00355C235E